MQMVALVELRLDVAGLGRVDHHLVEVDDAVELAAAADEVVDGETDLLFVGACNSPRRARRRKRRRMVSA